MAAVSITAPTQTHRLLMPLVLVLLSLLDAQFTLICIRRGGNEMNPIMALALLHSDVLFLVVKMLLTIIPAVVLASLTHRRSAVYGLYLANMLYGGIVYYHLVHLI